MDERSSEASCFLGHIDKRFASEPCRGEIEEEPMKEKSCPAIMGSDAPELREPIEHALNAITVPVTPSVCFLKHVTAFT